MSDITLKIEHATVRRDTREILKDASLTIKKGENISIIGPNGAGKSTLVGVMARKIYPLARDEYKNEIFGEEKWIISDLRKRIGLISPQEDDYCNTRYKVLEIVVSGLYSSLGFDFHHDVDDSDWEKGERALKDAGLYHLRDKRIDTLSTGERRRVLVVRAEITQPRMLILDEASSGMDFPSREDFRRSISSYASKERNIIMVTHELSEIIPEADRVILMRDGFIVFDGKKSEALTEERLSELYSRKVYVSEKNGIYTAFS